MKELNVKEINAVSGGCIIDSGNGEDIGRFVGSMLDSIASMLGQEGTTYSDIAAKVGSGIGNLFQFKVSEGFAQISEALNDLLKGLQPQA
ncbi:hypothetical protein ACFSFZ_20805 [Mixta tenebrionis]|uniref:Uncharacterized protein n=1 Tax=Mixta tenebrionis TaxID=2562439 RepID=A0A506V538_9GAMM|nr:MULTISPECIES: hypothetical protein [Mixta]QHM78025.1 hypothetical protein C7M52_04056 [Mixta theicola]TPW41004.1 hypothetical protein FKM52_16045 [Mixta tenebrionis]